MPMPLEQMRSPLSAVSTQEILCRFCIFSLDAVKVTNVCGHTETFRAELAQNSAPKDRRQLRRLDATKLPS